MQGQLSINYETDGESGYLMFSQKNGFHFDFYLLLSGWGEQNIILGKGKQRLNFIFFIHLLSMFKIPKNKTNKKTKKGTP